MKMRKTAKLLILGVFVLIALFNVETRPARANAMAYWRLVHASPDISSADVYVDGLKLASNFQFGTVSNYIPTPTGTHKIQVAIVGQGIGAAVMTQMVTVNPSASYTLVILGSQPNNFWLNVFQDDNSVSPGVAKVRAYHLSPDAGPLHIAVGSSTLASNLTYTHASGYVSIPAGSYTFDATSAQSSTAIPDSTILNDGTLTSVFAIGLLNSNPKIRLVSARTVFLPGMPQTGSDPNAQVQAIPSNGQPLIPWLLGTLALVGLAGSGMSRLRKTTHK